MLHISPIFLHCSASLVRFIISICSSAIKIIEYTLLLIALQYGICSIDQNSMPFAQSDGRLSEFPGTTHILFCYILLVKDLLQL